MAYKTQNTFKEPLEIEDRVAGWKFVLQGKYTMAQVLHGLRLFMEINPSMPVPANVNAILNPAKPRISEAAFVEAQKWQERNGFPMFSDALDVIEAYRVQEADARENHTVKCDKILQIAGSAVKRIGHE